MKRFIHIPVTKLTFLTSKAGGADVQAIKKRNGKVTGKLQLDWVPSPILSVLKERNYSKISKENCLLVSCEEYLNQVENQQKCIEKIQTLLEAAERECLPPTIPSPQQQTLVKQHKQKWNLEVKESKIHRKDLKQSRQAMHKFDP